MEFYNEGVFYIALVAGVVPAALPETKAKKNIPGNYYAVVFQKYVLKC
jgi:hypothetical protein